VREELVAGAPGHGCGHNLLGVAVLGAVIALKEEMLSRGIPGTIKYFGCPAEENLSGKAFMARDGVFDDLDACLTWHPGSVNRVRTTSSLANNAMNVKFYGRTAHAAADPYNGRSALDAVQLMNFGVEFLREHMPPAARVHYVITNGGLQPNVVPAEASVWYLIRSPKREEVDELYARVLDCMEGAAKMTQTTCEVELIKAIWNVLNNQCLENMLNECMMRVGPPNFSKEHFEFAQRISESVSERQKFSFIERESVTQEEADLLKSQVLNTTVISPCNVKKEGSGSTDVGDVSWCCPTAQFSTACNAIGTPGHSWQYAAQAGTGIGHEGMITAARVLAEAGLELMTRPDLLCQAREEFLRKTGGVKYKSAMPPDQKPAFHQFRSDA
jgi:aminobenzoyl-glutamate utilization protein B